MKVCIRRVVVVDVLEPDVFEMWRLTFKLLGDGGFSSYRFGGSVFIERRPVEIRCATLIEGIDIALKKGASE
jgi:hypothetical protein